MKINRAKRSFARQSAKGQRLWSKFLVISVYGALIASLFPASTVDAQLIRVGTFETLGDYVHKTGSDASAHGGWKRKSGEATKAKVKIKLQTKENRRFWFDSWPDATPWTEETVRSSHRRSRNRVNVRKRCNGSAVTWWRSVVDVDIIGYWDTPNKFVTDPRMLECGK